jgi:hypothetical protein
MANGKMSVMEHHVKWSAKETLIIVFLNFLLHAQRDIFYRQLYKSETRKFLTRTQRMSLSHYQNYFLLYFLHTCSVGYQK